MLLKGEPEHVHSWMENVDWRKVRTCLISIIIGSGVYGVTIGFWRALLQGVYVSLKFPLLILPVTGTKSTKASMSR